IADNTEILLNRGEAFTIGSGFAIASKNVVIGAYGNGDRPRINWTGTTSYASLITTAPTARDITIEDLSFDNASSIHIIHAGGTNISVRGCEFLHADYAVNTNLKPTGVLVQDNTAPLDTGLSECFAWLEGSDQVYLGNSVANSTRAHCIRSGGCDRVLIAYN